MDVITEIKTIQKILSSVNTPSILRFDESYFKDVNLIHCIISFDSLSVFEMDEFIFIDFDESLINNSSKVLIALYTGLNFPKVDIETIMSIISNKTNNLEYHISLHYEYDYDDDTFDLLCIFVE